MTLLTAALLAAAFASRASDASAPGGAGGRAPSHIVYHRGRHSPSSFDPAATVVGGAGTARLADAMMAPLGRAAPGAAADGRDLRALTAPQRGAAAAREGRRPASLQEALQQLEAWERQDRRFVAGEWANWSREEGACRPALHVFPTTVAEVVAVVRHCRSMGWRTRPAGGGLTPSAATLTADVLLHLTELNRIRSLNEATGVVCVEGGVTLEALEARLLQTEWSIPVVPSVLEGTIAGAIGTATHGTGLRVPTLSAFVRAVRVVDGTGAAHSVDATTATINGFTMPTAEAAKGLKILGAFACHLGALGVVVEVTLQLAPRRRFTHVSRCVPLDDALVPAPTEAATEVLQRAARYDIYRFLWTPHTRRGYELCAVAVDDTDGAAANVEDTVSSTPLREVRAAADSVMAAKFVDDRRPKSRCAALVAAATANPTLQHRGLEAALWVNTVLESIAPTPFLRRHATAAQVALNRFYQRTFLATPSAGVGATAVDLLVLDCLFRQHANEFAIDASLAGVAMQRLTAWLEAAEGGSLAPGAPARLGQPLRVHFPVEMRFTAADENVWLSPSYGRPTCYIGLVMFKPFGRADSSCGGDEVAASANQRAHTQDLTWRRYYEQFATMMLQLGGRPHWGKYRPPQWYDAPIDGPLRRSSADGRLRVGTNGAGAAVRRAAFPLLPLFGALRDAMDPDGVFVNEWLHRELVSVVPSRPVVSKI
jgi:L-gulonolactone oxidase